MEWKQCGNRVIPDASDEDGPGPDSYARVSRNWRTRAKCALCRLHPPRSLDIYLAPCPCSCVKGCRRTRDSCFAPLRSLKLLLCTYSETGTSPGDSTPRYRSKPVLALVECVTDSGDMLTCSGTYLLLLLLRSSVLPVRLNTGRRLRLRASSGHTW